MLQGQQYLHEIVPNGIFRNGSVVFLCLFDDAGEVTTTAVLHKDVEDTSVSVDVPVMISYDVLVVQLFEDVSMDAQMREGIERVGARRTLRRRSVFCRGRSCAQS